MIRFTLPRFLDNLSLNECLITLSRSNPEYFNFQNSIFSYADGAPAFFYWSESNYNNINKAHLITREELDYVNACSGAKLVLDCANPLLVPTDLYDVTANAIISTLNNGSNCALVSSPLMVEFFTNNYPDYYLIGSDHYWKQDPDKQYVDKLMTIRRRALDDNQYYADIAKSKICMCIASACWGCDKYEQCWEQDCLSRTLFSEKANMPACPLGRMQFLTVADINNLIKKGYSSFYIDANFILADDTTFFIKLYIDLFIKPEYQAIVKELLLRSLEAR